MNFKNIARRAGFSCPALLVMMTSSLWSQATRVVDVNQCRPLWYAMDALEDIVGTPINYEDPPYQNTADLQDFSTPEQRSAEPGYRLFGPPMARLTAEVQAPAEGAVAGSDVTVSDVNLLLAAYRQQNLPGEFKVEQANGMVYLTPTKVLGADGAMHDVVSPLATLVTIPSAERNIADTLQAILDEVNKGTRSNITIGWVRFWPTQRVTFAASREPARDALARLFAQVGAGQLSYRLIFDPVPDKMRIFDYALNVRAVAHNAARPAPIRTGKPPSGSVPFGATKTPQ